VSADRLACLGVLAFALAILIGFSLVLRLYF
jgi:hypothetical protein